MPNEFVIKHGFHSKDDSQVTGSLDVSGTSIVRSQRPFQTIGTNPFTASADNVGNYFRMGGNVTAL